MLLFKSFCLKDEGSFINKISFFHSMKRGVIEGQMFLYVLTIVILVLVLIFGYRMIVNFQERSEDLKLIKFKQDLQATIEGVTFGTKKIRTFDLPSGYKEFWLVDLVTLGNCPTEVPPLIQDSVSSGSPENAFLIGPEKFEAWEMERVHVARGCLHSTVTRNQLRLTLQKG